MDCKFAPLFALHQLALFLIHSALGFPPSRLSILHPSRLTQSSKEPVVCWSYLLNKLESENRQTLRVSGCSLKQANVHVSNCLVHNFRFILIHSDEVLCLVHLLWRSKDRVPVSMHTTLPGRPAWSLSIITEWVPWMSLCFCSLSVNHWDRKFDTRERLSSTQSQFRIAFGSVYHTQVSRKSVNQNSWPIVRPVLSTGKANHLTSKRLVLWSKIVADVIHLTFPSPVIQRRSRKFCGNIKTSIISSLTLLLSYFYGVVFYGRRNLPYECRTLYPSTSEIQR